MRDAEIRRPGGVGILPAAVDMVELVFVLEVSTVDGELVERVQHSSHGVRRRPRVWPVTLEDEHPVIDRRAGERTHCVLQRMGRVSIGGCAEDEIPSIVDVVDFRCPQLFIAIC